jgi:Flp pilus assembly protein TadG
MRRFFGSFFGDRRGNVAIIFALSLIPITMLVGASVDLSRMRVERTKLQSAVDAAALAAAQMPAGASDDEVDAAINSFLTANFDGEGALAIPVIDRDGTNVQISATSNLPMMFGGLFGMDTRPVSTSTGAARGGVNIEIVLVLDVTGSMAGTRIEDLQVAANDLIDMVVQTAQPPEVDYYTRMAIVPYSAAVNVGDLADDLRGAPPAAAPVSNVTWHTGTARTIKSISKKSEAVFTTTANHGFVNGDVVWLYGVQGMSQLLPSQLANGPYTVSNKTNTTFKLKEADGDYVKSNSWSTYTANSGGIAKCARPDCFVTITTAAANDFSNGDFVVINDLAGVIGAMNERGGTVANKTSNTFLGSGIRPGGLYSTVSPVSAGNVYCADFGCQYYRFARSGGGYLTYELDNCVTERTGPQRYTSAAPAANPLGRHYVTNPATTDCPTAEILPLTSDRDGEDGLHDLIDSLATEGGTAGQIGIAWGWYMLSPNFNAALSNNAAALGAEPPTLKIAVIMTDGEFNTSYCNGVITSTINCTAEAGAKNSAPFTQAAALCDAMEADGILIYTVGFGIDEGSTAGNFMENCASDDSYAYLAATGDQLSAAFGAIGTSISELRLTQ